MAEALVQVADILSLRVPTFGWAEGRRRLVKAGSGSEINRYLEYHPQRTDRLMRTLSYFDTMNFAGLVTCPTMIGVGLSDDIVPPETVCAIANHLTAPHEVLEYPVSHSDSRDEHLWENFERRWLKIALNGVPAGFGGSPVA